jgi:hypothetical protein
MWFRRRPKPVAIERGAVFRARRANRVVEIAEVIDAGQSLEGVPHIRFRLSLQRPGGSQPVVQGERTLALPSFADRFAGPAE